MRLMSRNRGKGSMHDYVGLDRSVLKQRFIAKSTVKVALLYAVDASDRPGQAVVVQAAVWPETLLSSCDVVL